MWAVPSSDLPAPSALLDPLFPERPVPSAAGDVPSAAGDVPSAAWDVHAAVRDRGDSSEARYAALAKRSAQTADRLLRRVSRHRAQGK